MAVKHFSHNHPLCLAEVKEEGEFICSGCELGLSGSAYKCNKSECDFLLHESCLKLEQEIQHKSHPEHRLSLLCAPPYDDSGFTCDACRYSGNAFVYHCAACQFDLHVGCASLPETVKRKDHEHPLVIFYSGYNEEDKIFICDVCHGRVHESCWAYYCQECDYCTHLNCATAEESPEEGSAEFSTAAAESQLKLLQLQLEIAKQNAQSIIDAGRMLSRLA